MDSNLFGFRVIEAQVECLVALSLLQSHDRNHNADGGIARRIRRLLAQEWQVRMTHVYREGNRCADFLASYVLRLEVGIHVFQEPPDGITGLLSEDALGVGRPRLCCNNL
ncbi:hypothetical protein QN277_016750 [Acacia crassicarpa]|uniref:RNase H type-1 domain-containing protein n=1 Tax=Acacia crassicarpa TaxID=499986 RepID=A0AAE1MXC0_9FABA|nr:hypothetical protein QN277_016750 [Acacia crassicarpa]